METYLTLKKRYAFLQQDFSKTLNDLVSSLELMHLIDLAKEFGDRLIGLRDGELVYDGKVSDVSDKDFENIYGRAIKSSDLLGEED